MKVLKVICLVVLWMSPLATWAQSSGMVETLYSFPTGSANGSPGYVSPSQGRDGAYYGTGQGAPGTGGVVFRLPSAGPEKAIYTFGVGTTTGEAPLFGVTLANDAKLYGVASGGQFGFGVLYRVGIGGKYEVVHQFSGAADGANPLFPPTATSDGALYGVTQGVGGASTVYRYRTTGTFETIYSFSSDYGQYASSPLAEALDGTLFGCAERGGNRDLGTVFQITKSGAPLWRYQFNGGADGYQPQGLLAVDLSGNIFGATSAGGAGLLGTAFKVDASRSFSTLYTFVGLRNGGAPTGGLVLGTDGSLYGSLYGGGPAGSGSLFKLSNSGVFELLYTFGGGGSGPHLSPLQATNGKFYGTTSAGGKNGAGTIYSLDVGLAPFVALPQPRGRVGTTAQILGQGFIGTSGVTFNGVAATSFTVVSDTYMTAIVPTGATTGSVVVTTPTGTLTSNKVFTVNQ